MLQSNNSNYLSLSLSCSCERPCKRRLTFRHVTVLVVIMVLVHTLARHSDFPGFPCVARGIVVMLP